MRVCLLLLLGTMPAARADDAVFHPEVSELKLRGSVTLRGNVIRFENVLLFGQVDQRLRDGIAQSAVLNDAQPGSVLVTHAQVEQRLKELGVNMARVLLGGAQACKVTVEAPEPAQTAGSPAVTADKDPAVDSPFVAGSPAKAGTAAGAGGSLADALRAHVMQSLSALSGEPNVEFERAGQEFLDLTSPPWTFSIRATGGGRLGMREFSITILRDGRVQRTVRIAARVQVVKPVLVAKRPLNAGAFVRREDLALEPRLFESEKDLGLEQADELIGQQVKRYLAVGAMLQRGDLKATDLVQRSRPVSLINDGGGVRMSLTGVALDSGGYGETVRVRLGESRKGQRELRGVVTGVGTVRIAEGTQ